MVEDRLDATFTALADPTRRAIVARLATGDATVNDLAEPFDMTLPGISKHLKVLERCGLITRSRRAQFRPCHLERDALDGGSRSLGKLFLGMSKGLRRLQTGYVRNYALAIMIGVLLIIVYYAVRG